MASLLPHQREWIVDGLYLQLGFINEHLLRGEPAAMGILGAMMFLDSYYCITRSLEPKDHIPLPLTELLFEGLVKDIGSLYKSGIGVWCRELIDLRNRALIELRAKRAVDDDPLTAYDRFVAAGGKYFLEYPSLCLEGLSSTYHALPA